MPSKDGDTDGMNSGCCGGTGTHLEAVAPTPGGGWRAPGTLTIVHGDHVQAVQELPFVLVDPLHVDVKHGGGVDLHLVLLLQELGELQLVFLWSVNRPEPPTQWEALGVRWNPWPSPPR